MGVDAGLTGRGDVGEAAARPAADAVDGLEVGRAPGPCPEGGMSRTLPVLGNSYGIALGTGG